MVFFMGGQAVLMSAANKHNSQSPPPPLTPALYNWMAAVDNKLFRLLKEKSSKVKRRANKGGCCQKALGCGPAATLFSVVHQKNSDRFTLLRGCSHIYVHQIQLKQKLEPIKETLAAKHLYLKRLCWQWNKYWVTELHGKIKRRQ